MSSSMLSTFHRLHHISYCCPVENKWGQLKRNNMSLVVPICKSWSIQKRIVGRFTLGYLRRGTVFQICNKKSKDRTSCKEGTTCFLATSQDIRELQKHQDLSGVFNHSDTLPDILCQMANACIKEKSLKRLPKDLQTLVRCESQGVGGGGGGSNKCGVPGWP